MNYGNWKSELLICCIFCHTKEKNLVSSFPLETHCPEIMILDILGSIESNLDILTRGTCCSHGQMILVAICPFLPLPSCARVFRMKLTIDLAHSQAVYYFTATLSRLVVGDHHRQIGAAVRSGLAMKI